MNRHHPVVRRLGAAVLVLALGVSVPALFGSPIAATSLRSSRVNLTVEFPRTVGLYPQSRVVVQGIEAGTVTKVEPRADRVLVRLSVHGVTLAPDAKATLRLRSLIGERYVELGPVWSGKGPSLGDDAVIPLERAIVPAEISDVLDEASRVAQGIDGKVVGRLVHELAASLDKDAVAGATVGLATVSQAVAARATELDSSLVHLQGVVGALASRDDRIVDLMRSSTVVSQALLAQDGALGSAITGLDGLLGELSRVTAANGGKFVVAVDALDRVGRLLAEHEAGWQDIITKLPWASYGFYRAIDHDGDRWFLMPQASGVLFVPYAPNLNSRGGPGSDKDDNRVVPRLDLGGSVARALVPEELDLTGATGPGPLLPASSIGPVTIDGGGRK